MGKKNGRWTINTSKIIYKNPWITLIEDMVIRPDGKPGIYGYLNVVPAVTIIPIDKEGNVYLVKEFKYPIGKYSIEAVGGSSHEGEDPLDAAKRELKEELGITAKKYTSLGMANSYPSLFNSPSYLFLAERLEFGNTNLEGTEDIVPVKMTLNEAYENAMKNEITHAQTIVAILKIKEYLSRK